MAELTTAARPYAKAAFELAQQSGDYESWSGKLSFWSSLLSDKDMAAQLEAPQLTHEQKAGLIEKVAGEGMDESGRNFIRLLAENGRLAAIPDVASIYEELRNEAEGNIDATVISAYALNDDQRQRMTEALSKRLNRQVRIINEVDENLIGGAVIRAGGLVIDGSLKGRLENMEQAVGK